MSRLTYVQTCVYITCAQQVCSAACVAATVVHQSLHYSITRAIHTPCAFSGLVSALGAVSSFLQVPFSDVVPVVNATSAVNAVVNGIQLGPEDLLLMTNATYPAVSVHCSQNV